MGHAAWNTRTTQPAATPDELRRVFCEYHLHSRGRIYAFDECMVPPCGSARRLLATPNDITGRARRAVYALGPMIELVDLSDDEIQRAVEIITAEFGRRE